VLNIDDIPVNNHRDIRAGTGYPESERFTLQLIEILEGVDRSTVEQLCYVGRNAAFSTGTQMAKPSGLLLHYNYGAAALKWWGHHTDILRSQDPPHPSPPLPPHRHRRRRPRPRPAPARGPSTAGPSYLTARPTYTHDRTVSINKRGRHSTRSSKKKGVQRLSTVDVADEPINKSKAWESWDEDDWMLFCRLNTKAAHERLQAAEGECSSNIRAWAQKVSESTELQ
jgi:hypothetical protein